VSSKALRPIVEAIATWQQGLFGGRARMVAAAADLLAEGIDGPAVVEMASIYSDEDSFRIDLIIEKVIAELRLEQHLAAGSAVLATRSLCRSVLAGEVTEHTLSEWVHTRFGHTTASELLNELAELYDEYDVALDSRRGDRHNTFADQASCRADRRQRMSFYNDNPNANVWLRKVLEAGRATERVAESIAAWQRELRGEYGRHALVATAAELVGTGVSTLALVDLAGVYADGSPWRFDVLVERVISELQLEDDLKSNGTLLATRWLCRGVVTGAVSERELAEWVLVATDERGCALFTDLAALGDEYDYATALGMETGTIDARVRRLAERFLGAD
jgi:hypothetical protein